MIPKYINEWINIIEKMKNVTTYKLAFGRSVIECLKNKLFHDVDDEVYVDLYDISENVLKYYWNQYYFFKLKQAGPASKNKAIILEEVKKLISIYQKLTESTYPIWFDLARTEIRKKKLKEYDACISKIGVNLKANPIKYFLNLDGRVSDIYYLKDNKIFINKDNSKDLIDYADILTIILNYKWAQLLEEYNSAPKINKKVAGASQSEIRRNNLKKFISSLILITGNKPIDFYTGKELASDDISVDHVIPWSFMYSDDIWNLVLTTKSNNSKKSNIVPSEDVIERLKERNKKLVNLLNDEKLKISMEEAIENNYVDKFYNSCRYDFK